MPATYNDAGPSSATANDVATGPTTDPAAVALLGSVASIATRAHDVESLVRPLLEILARVTGLEATYMTYVDHDRGIQTLTYVYDGGLTIPEGFELPWEDTLCQQCLLRDDPTLPDVVAIAPDHPAVVLVGMRGFVSIPFSTTAADGSTHIVGTLCGASSTPITEDASRIRLVELFAQLIGDRIERESRAAEDRDRAVLAELRLLERTRFVAAAEHTLKSPLAVLVGWSATLVGRWDQLSEEQKLDGVERIEGNARKLTERVSEMLGEAQSSLVAATLRLADLELHAASQRDVADFSGVSPLHTVELLAGPDVVVRADGRALHQILTHLLENAIKYAPEGGTIEVSATARDGVGVLRVADRGIGLPDEVDLFAPFERGGHGIEGSGIGLYIVRNLAESMGGEAHAYPRDGGGALFEIELPLAG